PALPGRDPAATRARPTSHPRLSPIDEIPNLSSLGDALPLECRHHTALEAICPFALKCALEKWFCIEHFAHLERVVLPVGGEPQHTTVGQCPGCSISESRSNETALRVPL